MLEKTLEHPLDWNELKPVKPQGNQSWIFIGRTDAEAEAPILWPPDAKNWLIRKDPDAGKNWGQEEKGMTEDKMVGWHHWFNGHEFEQALEDGDREAWHVVVHGVIESDMTEWLNWRHFYLVIPQFFIAGKGYSLSFIFGCTVACRTSLTRATRLRPMLPAVEVQILNHWTTSEVLVTQSCLTLCNLIM